MKHHCVYSHRFVTWCLWLLCSSQNGKWSGPVDVLQHVMCGVLRHGATTRHNTGHSTTTSTSLPAASSHC